MAGLSTPVIAEVQKQPIFLSDCKADEGKTEMEKKKGTPSTSKGLSHGWSTIQSSPWSRTRTFVPGDFSFLLQVSPMHGLLSLLYRPAPMGGFLFWLLPSFLTTILKSPSWLLLCSHHHLVAPRAPVRTSSFLTVSFSGDHTHSLSSHPHCVPPPSLYLLDKLLLVF